MPENHIFRRDDISQIVKTTYRDALKGGPKVVWNWANSCILFTFCRQENTTFSPHFHRTWGPMLRASPYYAQCGALFNRSAICTKAVENPIFPPQTSEFNVWDFSLSFRFRSHNNHNSRLTPPFPHFGFKAFLLFTYCNNGADEENVTKRHARVQYKQNALPNKE